MEITITRATVAHAAAVAVLFNDYRIFYKQAPDLAAAEQFIGERLAGNDSVIFIATVNNEVVGFTQLYPIFTSVGMQRTWLLNDLYVAAPARGQGIGEALLNAAKTFGAGTNSKWLMLETGNDNIAAQRLYEKNGWQRGSDLVYMFRY